MVVQNYGFVFFSFIAMSWFLEGHNVFAARASEFDNRTTPDPEYGRSTPVDDSEPSTLSSDSTTVEYNPNSTPMTPFGRPNVRNDDLPPTVYNPAPPPRSIYRRPNMQDGGPYQGPFMQQGGPYGGSYLPQVGPPFLPMPYGAYVPYSPAPMPYGPYLPPRWLFPEKHVEDGRDTVSAFHKFSFFNPQFLNNVKVKVGK